MKNKIPTKYPIKKGSTIEYQGGFYNVKALFKNHCTLNGVWGGKIRHRKVPLTEITEAQEKHYEQWSNSESYRCM